MPLVDTDRLEKDAAAESRARWKTGRGFVWPAARKPGEYNRHPLKPSEQRCDILAEPWAEPWDGALSRGIEHAPHRPAHPKDFDTVPKAAGGIFGNLTVPRFEHAYDYYYY